MSLYECHGHIIADGYDYRASQSRHERGVDADYVRTAFALLNDAGVMYYRDGGDKLGVSAYAKTVAHEYGVEYRTPLYIIHRENRYGALYGKSYADKTSCAALIKSAAEHGADFIKTAASGMLDFDGDGSVLGENTPPDELAFIVKTAAEHGLRVMVHANGAENVKNALNAGVSSIEHGFFADRDAIALLRDKNAVWVPTCVTVANNLGGTRYPPDTMRRILDAHAELLAYARNIGALVACGSDCGAYGVPQGRGTLDERAFLRELGIDTADADERVRFLFRRGGV